MENKQTAVEYLVDKLKNQGFLYEEDIEAAKAMEKEQIKDAYVGYNDDEFGLLIHIKDMAEQYYNETYGQN